MRTSPIPGRAVTAAASSSLDALLGWDRYDPGDQVEAICLNDRQGWIAPRNTWWGYNDEELDPFEWVKIKQIAIPCKEVLVDYWRCPACEPF